MKRTRMFLGCFIAASTFIYGRDVAFAAADDVTSTSTRRLRSTAHRRRLISKDENIVDIIGSLEGAAVRPIGFDIEVEGEDEWAGSSVPSSVSFDSTTTLMLHLDEMTSAVTSNTRLYFPEISSSNHEKVDASKFTFLASSPSSSTTQDLTVVSVNTHSGEVNGLQQHGESGMIRQLSPKNDDNCTALQLRLASMSSEPRQFGNDTDHDDFLHSHMTNTSQSDHDDHDLYHHSLNETEPHHSGNSTDATETAHPGFQIDLIIDIDRDLIKQNGGLEKAIEYVNYIVSTTNIILKNEFDLHLNVVQISETTLFKELEFGAIREALKLMRKTYTGTVGKDNGAHLRHALLGKELGGGIAFTDSVCDTNWGFGISSGLRGDINNMDLYDVFVFAHELGHSLGSGHPFDGEYSPPVDTCQLGSCPEGLPLNASSTLMSYCGHFCGGMSNTAFTYGGVWNQISPREDLNSWLQNPALVNSSISTDAQRISHSIWMKLIEKEECIIKRDPVAPLSTIFLVDNETSVAESPASNVTAPSPSQNPSSSLFPTVSSMPSSSPTFTNMPSSVPTLTSSSKPTLMPSSYPSNYPTALPSFSPTMYPIGMPSSSPSRGVHSISPLKQCTNRCKRTNAYMFNVQLKEYAANDIEIISITFRHKAPKDHRVIRVYTNNEGYKGNEESLESWTKYSSGRASKQINVSTVRIDPPLRIKAGETVGFYLETEENIMLGGKFGKTTTLDDNGVKMQYGMARFNDQFTENISWSGSVEYEIVDNLS